MLKKRDVVVVADDDDDDEVTTSVPRNRVTATLSSEELFLRTQYIHSSLLISARWYNFEAVFIGFYLKCQLILLQWEQLYCSAIHSFFNWYLRQSQNRPWHVCEEGSEVSLLLFHTISTPSLCPDQKRYIGWIVGSSHSLPLSKQEQLVCTI